MFVLIIFNCLQFLATVDQCSGIYFTWYGWSGSQYQQISGLSINLAPAIVRFSPPTLHDFVKYFTSFLSLSLIGNKLLGLIRWYPSGGFPSQILVL